MRRRTTARESAFDTLGALKEFRGRGRYEKVTTVDELR